MPLTAGTRLGPYEVISLLGAGGMGEVYRARDARLGRNVALKVLPPAFAADEERMGRFEREAQLLASLNHPNIAILHGLEESGGVRALVMELVEGPTLADRLAAGPLPLEEALAIARQIAEALEAAHERGIVHRDLKPANVKITPEGVVKVLDFGLAKVAEDPAVSGNPAASPTLTLAATRAGVILGTAAYMSPEQASGRPVDKRADIWAFGVVLWECLGGRRLFEGETVSHTLADVLRAEIDVNKLPAGTPPVIRDLIRRCLDRDVKSRLRDIGEARIVIQKYLASPDAASSPPAAIAASPPVASTLRRVVLPWAVAAVLLVLCATLAAIHFRERPPEAYPIRFTVSQPDKVTFQWFDLPVISPDGRNLAFTGTMAAAGGGAGANQLWIRPLDAVEARPLAGTDGAYLPFWSPDGRFIAFFSAGKLKKIDIAGGPPVTLCDGALGGGAWSRDGVILLASNTGTIQRVSAAGGDPKPVLGLDKVRQETSQTWPAFLPDGRHFLYLSRAPDPGKAGIFVASLDAGEPRLLVTGESKPAYAPPGYLLFTRQETLFAQPLDLSKLQVRGEAVPVAEGVGRMTSMLPGSLYSASENGVLAFRGGNAADLRLVWYGRDGKRLGALGDPGFYRQIALSPDETRLTVERYDAKTSTWDIWLLETRSAIFSRLTFSPADDSDPVWSPDGRQIAFNSNRKGQLDLYRKEIGSGQEELLLENAERKVPEAWLKDNSILYTNFQGKTIYRLPLQGDRKPEILLQTEFPKDEPHVSLDERWVAYGSLESGRWEVYVASFPRFTDRRQVSSSGGGQALWRKDGRELYYFSLDGKMMAVDVKVGATLETGLPRVLFETRLRPSPLMDQYAVTGDGAKFLVAEPVEEAAKPMTILLNWTAHLSKK